MYANACAFGAVHHCIEGVVVRHVANWRDNSIWALSELAKALGLNKEDVRLTEAAVNVAYDSLRQAEDVDAAAPQWSQSLVEFLDRARFAPSGPLCDLLRAACICADLSAVFTFGPRLLFGLLVGRVVTENNWAARRQLLLKRYLFLPREQESNKAAPR